MNIEFNEIAYLKDPDELTLKADFQQFLLSLDVPTIIDVTGKNTDICRVIVTLLHGNEPSGLIAIHRWLTTDYLDMQPETNLRFIVCSVEAASKTPILTHRYLDNGKDLNRCFGTKKNTSYYTRANLIAKAIAEVSPEVVIDLHNTSGSGPAFSVSPELSPLGLSVTALFCDTIILSGLQLGALMEQDFDCPIVTVECGGSNDEQAHEVAYYGIAQLSKSSMLSNLPTSKQVNIVYKPLRLQLRSHRSLSYSCKNEGLYGVTLCSKIEQFNFGGAKEGQLLGWLDEKGLANLQLLDDSNNNVVEDFFTVRDNQLVCATNMQIFMATTNKAIAINDCLFYVV